MMNTLKKLTLSLCVLSTLSGCAMVRSANSDVPVVPYTEHQFANSAESTAQAKVKNRKRSTLLTIGGIVLLGAIVAHEGQDGARDALRDADRP